MPASAATGVVMGALWPWSSLYNRSQPLALALARLGCQVYYLSPHERRRVMTNGLIRWLQRRGLQPSGRVVVQTGVHPNLHLIEAASLHARTTDWWMRDYTSAATRALRQFFAARAKRGESLHLFASRPTRVSLLRLHPWARVVLDVVDPWPLMPWGELPLAQVGIAQMFDRADIIVSNGLLAGELYRETSPRPIHNLPNGVESSLLEALAKNPPLPEPLRRGRGKFRLLFTGAMDMRINFEMLAAVIPEFSEVDFYFVGKALLPPEAEPVWRRMLAMPNCFHVRTVPYAAVPQYLGNAHGLLLPYSEWGSNRMFPGKLLEYVAAARPIYAPFMAPELESAHGAFNLYRDIDGLRAALRQGFATSFQLPEDVAESCRRLARESTWDRRAEALCALWDENNQAAGAAESHPVGQRETARESRN